MSVVVVVVIIISYNPYRGRQGGGQTTQLASTPARPRPFFSLALRRAPKRLFSTSFVLSFCSALARSFDSLGGDRVTDRLQQASMATTGATITADEDEDEVYRGGAHLQREVGRGMDRFLEKQYHTQGCSRPLSLVPPVFLLFSEVGRQAGRQARRRRRGESSPKTERGSRRSKHEHWRLLLLCLGSIALVMAVIEAVAGGDGSNKQSIRPPRGCVGIYRRICSKR